MVNLVTAEHSRADASVEALAQALKRDFPAITTIVHNINRKKGQVAIGDEERTLVGEGCIREKIGDKVFQISANSFFQTNTRQAARLYDEALAMAELAPGDVVYDLYSGTGVIALHLSGHCDRVLGLEVVAGAVEDAVANAERNGVTNCTFLCMDLKDVKHAAPEMRRFGRPDVVVVDPPAFAKNLGQRDRALRAYERLNAQALRTVAPDGLLLTCSCSGGVNAEEFEGTVRGALASERR